jgi:hypothetical protein
MHVIGRATDKIFADVEMDAALGAHPADDPFHLGHDFRADAVTGKDKEGGIGHGTLSAKFGSRLA